MNNTIMEMEMMFYVYIIILAPLISGQTEVRKESVLMIDTITSPSPPQEKIKVLSNYGDGLLNFGEEEVVTNYMELSEDPKGERIRSSEPFYSVVQVICQRSSPSAVQSGCKTSRLLLISSCSTR